MVFRVFITTISNTHEYLERERDAVAKRMNKQYLEKIAIRFWPKVNYLGKEPTYI